MWSVDWNYRRDKRAEKWNKKAYFPSRDEEDLGQVLYRKACGENQQCIICTVCKFFSHLNQHATTAYICLSLCNLRSSNRFDIEKVLKLFRKKTKSRISTKQCSCSKKSNLSLSLCCEKFVCYLSGVAVNGAGDSCNHYEEGS